MLNLIVYAFIVEWKIYYPAAIIIYVHNMQSANTWGTGIGFPAYAIDMVAHLNAFITS